MITELQRLNQPFYIINCLIKHNIYIDKYGSKHTGSRKNVQANIEVTYGKMRTNGVYRQGVTNGVYIQEGK